MRELVYRTTAESRLGQLEEAAQSGNPRARELLAQYNQARERAIREGTMTIGGVTVTNVRRPPTWLERRIGGVDRAFGAFMFPLGPEGEPPGHKPNWRFFKHATNSAGPLSRANVNSVRRPRK